MCCSMCEVICGQMVLGVVVGDVVGAFVPVEAKLALRLQHRSQWRRRQSILIRRAMMVSLVNPTAVEFLVWMGDGGCGHPILMSVLRRGTISWAVMNNADSSASAADAMTNFTIWEIVRTGSLSLGMGSFSVRKMLAPARLRDLDSPRKLASECAARIMLLALYVVPSDGYVAT